MEYYVLTETDPQKLSKIVNEYLDKGWELYGNIDTIQYKDHAIPGVSAPAPQIWFTQTVIFKNKPRATK